MEENRRYLTSRYFYGALVLQSMAEIIRARGGDIVRQAWDKVYTISNRSMYKGLPVDESVHHVEFTTYIRFNLNGMSYYYQYNDNPDVVVKYPEGSKKEYYGQEKDGWMRYDYEQIAHTSEEVCCMAAELLQKLIDCPMSEEVR